jgi:hypothetical protein
MPLFYCLSFIHLSSLRLLFSFTLAFLLNYGDLAALGTDLVVPLVGEPTNHFGKALVACLLL